MPTLYLKFTVVVINFEGCGIFNVEEKINNGESHRKLVVGD